jgi:hypothetical protein
MLPPYTTAKTPIVAMHTAINRRGDHLRLKTFTEMTYAKNALVFHMAVTSLTLWIVSKYWVARDCQRLVTYDAREMAINQRRAGAVKPSVMTETSLRNGRVGNGSPGDVRWDDIATKRPCISPRKE